MSASLLPPADVSAKKYLDAKDCGIRYGCSWRHWLRLVDSGLRATIYPLWSSSPLVSGFSRILGGRWLPLLSKGDRAMMKCNHDCHPCRCGEGEGERYKADALALLADRREAVVRRARRALLTALLEDGTATVDAVRAVVELPSGINPKVFGSAPGELARHRHHRRRRLREDVPNRGPCRPITVWALADRAAAERWLRDHPDLPDPDEGAAGSQRVLFPTNPTNEPVRRGCHGDLTPMKSQSQSTLSPRRQQRPTYRAPSALATFCLAFGRYRNRPLEQIPRSYLRGC